MAQKKNQPTTLRERIETSLRGVCGRVSPDRRAAVIIAMLVVFAALNIFVTGRAIRSIGRDDAPHYTIEIPAMEPAPIVEDSDFDELIEQQLNSQDNDNATIEQETER